MKVADEFRLILTDLELWKVKISSCRLRVCVCVCGLANMQTHVAVGIMRRLHMLW